jgi:hypothetical protein
VVRRVASVQCEGVGSMMMLIMYEESTYLCSRMLNDSTYCIILSTRISKICLQKKRHYCSWQIIMLHTVQR